MVTKLDSHIWSNLPVRPGDVLEDELAERGMSQKELARRAGRPAQVINEIVRGKKAITHETALELEKVLGITAQFWINLESIYRMTLARNQERELLEQQVPWLDRFPVRELAKRGWIRRHADKVDKVRALLGFLGIASFDDSWSEAAVGLRITGGPKFSEGALAVWLRQGQLDGGQISAQPYSERRFLHALDEVRKLTSETPEVFLPEMKKLCAEAGVAVVLTQELPKSGANGVARWLTPEKALIQLSIRWRWADIFWFTFFHEAYHILRHELKTPHVEGKGINSLDKRAEHEANGFARDLLIDPTDWAAFLEGGDWGSPTVERFAEEISVDPGIVGGRLQHEGLIAYNPLTTLKTRLKWVENNDNNE